MPEATDLGADAVAHRGFRTTFRGYDQHEVRAHLGRVAAALAEAEDRARLLAEQLAAAEPEPPPVELGEEELEAALGAHAATVLQAARTAAADLRAAAEREVAERREALDAEAEATVAAAEERARAIVAEAHAEREAVVRDLARRQRAAHQQLAQLRADRAGLLEALSTARSVADGAMERLAAASDEPSTRRRRARDGQPPTEAADGEPDATGGDVERPSATRPPPSGPQADPVGPPTDEEASRRGTRATADVTDSDGTVDASVDAATHAPGAAVAAGGEGPVDLPAGTATELAAAATPGAADATGAGDAPDDGSKDVASTATGHAADVRPLPDDDADPPDRTGAPVGVAGGTSVRRPVTALLPGGPAGRGVDDVLARLREDRAASLAQAAAVLTDLDLLPSDPAGPTAPPPAVTSPPPGSGAPPPPSPTDDDPTATDVFEWRDGEVDLHERALARALKRALADEQNWLLDALRRARGVPDVGRVLVSPAEQARRLADVGEPFLAAVAAAASSGRPRPAVEPACGADLANPPPGAGVDVREEAVALGTELVAGLRARLARVTGGGGPAQDEAAVGEAVSVAYRECRAERVQPLARHAVSAAWGAGAYRAAPEGLLSWVVDPSDRCSADCEDNALAGPTPKGQPFPTGHRHPPAHPGCRCLLVPASR